MSSSADALREAWRELGGRPSDATADLLVERHAEPHRRYHTAEHVAEVLRHIDTILASPILASPILASPILASPVIASAEIGSCEPLDADAVRAAALFHDVVYEPMSATNEADSAELAMVALAGLGWDQQRVESVRTLILATATHIANDLPTAVLIDADLAILGADTEAYHAYRDGIRFEYGFVDDVAWRTGRAGILGTFLEREHIYRTPMMAGTRELPARANLAAELSRLVSDERR